MGCLAGMTSSFSWHNHDHPPAREDDDQVLQFQTWRVRRISNLLLGVVVNLMGQKLVSDPVGGPD